MNSTPHQLLSAYLDGELTPSERDVVERLLEESPEARQELQELEQVGELLRQLPREVLPDALAMKLPSEDAPTKPQPAIVEPASKSSRAGFAGVGISVAALLLVMIAAFAWRPNRETPHTKITQHVQESDWNQDSPSPADRLQMPRDMPMASANPVKNLADHLQPPFAEVLPANPPNTLELKPDQPFDQSENLKKVPIDQMVAALDFQADEVIVVRVAVQNSEQGLHALQGLLRTHQIPTANSRNGFGDSATRNLRPNSKIENEKPGDKKSDVLTNNLTAVYVEADNDRITKAIRELEKLEAIQNLTMDSPVKVAQLDSLVVAENLLRKQIGEKRRMSFGGAGLGQPQKTVEMKPRIQAARTPKSLPAPAPANPAEEPAAKPGESQTLANKNDKAEAREKAKPQFTAPKKPAGIGTASTPLLPEFRGHFPQTDARKGAEPGNGTARELGKKPKQNGASESKDGDARDVRSRQQHVVLTLAQLKALQQQIAHRQKEASREPGDQSPTPKRVHVLFVLVDPPQK